MIFLVFILLPFATGMIQIARSSYYLNRISHILQENAMQIWLCRYYAFAVGPNSYLILDEPAAKIQIRESIEQNFQLAGIADTRLDEITINSVERFSHADNSNWQIPLIELRAVYTDHLQGDIPIVYTYEMAPSLVWFKDGTVYE